MTQFTDLGLAETLLRAVDAEGYTTPTPIQAKAIPPILQGRDLIGIAQTGTGKTAAFTLPILHRLATERRPAPLRGARALVLAPTRELAAQIQDSVRTYGRFAKVTSTVVFGGVGMRPQVTAMARGVDVLIATPGRLLDHLRQGTIRLDGVEIVVLDEVDRMLDMGFVHDVRRLLKLLPAKRQGLFLSATLPPETAAIASELLRDPVRVEVTPPATTVERIEQAVLPLAESDKRPALKALLDDPSVLRAIVFTRTKHRADRVVKHLEQDGIDAAAIHGNKSQGQRERALQGFKDGRIRVLVATDIAARGIDVDEISHVVQFDLPDVPESYVHRIGRTARAGASGRAIAFCSPEERGQWRDIERKIARKVPLLEGLRFTRGTATTAGAAAPPRPEPRGQAPRRRAA